MKVNRNTLLTSLGIVQPALRSSSSLPVLAFLWFREGYVYAYDGGMGMACALPAGVDLSGGVHGGTMIKLLESSNKDTIDIVSADNDSGIELKLGGPKAKLAITSADRFFWNFPTEAPDGDPLFTITEDMIKAIKAVLPLKSDKPTQAVHHSVLVQSSKKSTFFFTTDTRSAAKYIVDGPSPIDDVLLLPRAFAQELIRYGKPGMSVWGSKEAVSLFAGQTAGQIQVHSNALDPDEVPNIAKVIEAKEDSAGDGVKVPAGLSEALDRAKILSGADDPVVILEGTAKELSVVGTWTAGSLDETLPLEDGEEWPDRRVKVDASLVKRGLALAEFIALGNDCVVMYGADGRYTYVLASVD